MNKTLEGFKLPLKKETWIDNFQYMCSKDNPCYPKNFREYFDTPRLYDVNGDRK